MFAIDTQESIKIGVIKTYLPEKKYGFIKGDDGKDYFFHQNAFKDKKQIAMISEEAYVSFDQKATPKGYRAVDITLKNASDKIT
jgi:cold shock CspA family protein